VLFGKKEEYATKSEFSVLNEKLNHINSILLELQRRIENIKFVKPKELENFKNEVNSKIEGILEEVSTLKEIQRQLVECNNKDVAAFKQINKAFDYFESRIEELENRQKEFIEFLNKKLHLGYGTPFRMEEVPLSGKNKLKELK